MQAGVGRRMALDCIREAEAKISSLELRVRDLQAKVNTLQLRLDSLEQESVETQAVLAGPYNIGLRAELSALHKVVADCVESANRSERELLLLLSWRTNFSKRLQAELQDIGFRFASAAPRFEPAYLDSLD